MLWVKLGTHITDHDRFLAVGALARDLWTWGMLYAGKHETDGELSMAAVAASAWGRGDRGNVHLASTLVSAGLWLRTPQGFTICRWAEQGNETMASIIAKREAGKARKAKFEAAQVTRSERVRNGVSNAFGSTSTSSESLISSGSDLTREPPAELTPALRAVVAQVCEPTGATLDADHEWLTFVAHSEREARRVTAASWRYWLCNAAKYAKKDRARERERDDAAAERKRFAREGPAPPPKLTREQSEAFAEQLAARMGLKAKVGT